MASELKVDERLFVWTALGEREIQLCLGDITALSPEDGVDFVMVSCFPGDYSPMRGTVMGALHHDLGISVRQLAKHKKEDLRQKFHCWISHQLEAHLPYRQVLCFERMHNSLTEAVKEIFRAMMPAFNNTNKSVITPLLATGHQRADELEMLRTMVLTAAKWMWLGMPLQTFKIVLYCRNLKNPTDVSWQASDTFRKLKTKLERVKNIPPEPGIELDVFLIFSESELDLAVSFVAQLKKTKKSLKVRTVKDMQFKEESWQHDLFNFMHTVSRVVPLLTSQFLSEDRCIDQFNVAVCCNRLTKRHLLAPVLMERLDLPAYVNLLQWINCRDQTEDQLEQASSTLVEQVKTGNAPRKAQYDIFISYCHKNIAVAKQLVEGLEKLSPKPKVFFDFEELTTGVSWQEALYRAIDNTRCIVALLSPAYLESAVCTEEMNLALAKHLHKEKSLELVPVQISDLPNPEPGFLQYVRPVLLGGDMTIDSIVGMLSNWLSTGDNIDIFSPVAEPLDYEGICSKSRQRVFEEHYQYKDYVVEIKAPESQYPTAVERPDKDLPCHLYISHSVRDQRFATFLSEYLQSLNPELKVCDKSSPVTNRAPLLNSAVCIVVLLSPAYVNSMHESEEFGVILGRDRQTKDRRLLYVFKTDELRGGPTYFSIVPCDTSLMDDMWWALAKDQPKFREKHQAVLETVKKKASAIKVMELCPLLKVACDVLRIFKFGRYLPDIRHKAAILDSVVEAHLASERLSQSEQDVAELEEPIEASVMPSPGVVVKQVDVDIIPKVQDDPQDVAGESTPKKVENEDQPTEPVQESKVEEEESSKLVEISGQNEELKTDPPTDDIEKESAPADTGIEDNIVATDDRAAESAEESQHLENPDNANKKTQPDTVMKESNGEIEGKMQVSETGQTSDPPRQRRAAKSGLCAVI